MTNPYLGKKFALASAVATADSYNLVGKYPIKELIVALRGEIYFVKFIINPEEDDIEPGVVLGRSFLRLTKGITYFGNEIITIYPDLDPFNDVESDKANDSEDDWDVISEGIDFGDIREIDGLELPPYVYGELELEEVEANEEMIREYKAIKEKEDLGVFVLPIRLEGIVDTHALADTDSNINIIPYCIFKELGREHVKPVSHNGTTSTFDGVCHKKFHVAEIQNNGEESDSDDEEEYYLKRDEIGRPFYSPKLISYFDRNDPMERAFAIQDSINPFRKICV
ncbi:hypothetical protein Tco_0779100 [Tanacetum coccineum]